MSSIGWKPPEERDPEIQQIPGIGARLLFMRVVIVLVLSLLVYRVYWLQQTKGPDLVERASQNQFAELTTDAPRGVILDRNGRPLAINKPSFNVTITPAFLPSIASGERQGIYERLSMLTGVPITNTVKQEALIAQANPELVSTYTRLAQIYGASVEETLDEAGIVPRPQASIEGIVEENSFAPYVPAIITTGVTISEAYRIEQESIFLRGVRIVPQALREYPTGEFTAHLIGYMGPVPNQNWIDVLGYERDDRVGWAGLESSMELELAGVKGRRRIEQDWTGREVRQVGEAEQPQAGLNLHLTLDSRLQMITYDILRQFMEADSETPRPDEITGEPIFPEIEQAAVVVLNPKTGEVLAMVNLPTFDNNRFQTEVPVDYYLGLARNEYTPLVNHAISGTYPPGSTFKLVPASAALQEGIISPDRFLFDPGTIEIPNRFAPNDPGRVQPFVCWNLAGHGLMNMRLAIKHSCDVYFYKITGGFDQDGEFVEGLTVDRIDQYGHQFGYGRIQGIELPLEAEGNLPTRAWKRQTQGEPWSTGDDYNLGIGQGFMTATPLQQAQMVSVVANGGFLYRPTIIHHMTDADGNIVFSDNNGQIIARAHQDRNGAAVVTDADGNVLENPPVNVQFDAEGNYVFQPEVIDTLAVDRDYLRVVQEGMRMVNKRNSEEDFGTGATYVDWEALEAAGIPTAGKTGTAEYCDNIAITRGWCRFEDIAQRRILPTHAWYVAYAPYDDPQIAVSVFIFNGGEGSLWATPVACHVIAAYFGVGQYASLMGNLTPDEAAAQPTVCDSRTFFPDLPQLDFGNNQTPAGATPDGSQPPTFEGGIVPVDPQSGIDNLPVATPSDVLDDVPVPTTTP
ncbi:MAG: penicillin-binding protein 2 [Anaerolineales bacterium]|uniref:penicillin-binding protein 2 n=1 Tax=Promineifilum sp. TaxID=2664178 RepID=UPI001D20FD3A|nr:penicillin-binding protein 2 [Anaerolineales bacterium]MCB8933836.1 penicillin-binding protein 2 [Promineifilum sp.]MCO5181411.1 penicillin-binding protein 2 [Promineifilum sp.]